MRRKHSMPFGAECLEDGKVRFRLWAPKAEKVDLYLYKQNLLPLTNSVDCWFELVIAASSPTQYQFFIDGHTKVPDLASRFPPSDVHVPSAVVDADSFD